MHRLHLPFVSTPGNSDVGAAASGVRAAFVAAWLLHPLQQRRNCLEDGRLTAAAVWMAQDMAVRAAAGTLRGDLHRDSLGRNANGRVRTFGYPLPGDWPDGDNWCESVAIDHRGAAATLKMLLDSPSHYDHIVGVGWFGAQTRYGCAFLAPAWWALVTAPEMGG